MLQCSLASLSFNHTPVLLRPSRCPSLHSLLHAQRPFPQSRSPLSSLPAPQDRTKLSKIEWKYIIIDEAQRMKERESKLSKDLDKFVAERRLLLTGQWRTRWRRAALETRCRSCHATKLM